MRTQRSGRPAGLPRRGRTTREPADGLTGEPEVPQYGLGAVFGIWAGAALPMGVLAWFVAPAVADRLSGAAHLPMAKALLVCLSIGLIWQFVLVLTLIGREQHTLHWPTVREALWLRAPRSPRTGRVGGRVWLVVVPLIVLFAAAGLVPQPAIPAERDIAFLGAETGKSFLGGNWAWFAVLVVLLVFNTALGEELLFRGLLLPRMNGAFGRGDWVANGLLFAAYHLHMPWLIPVSLLDTFLLAYPSKRYRSAWIGITVHSAQSVFFLGLTLPLVI